MHFSSSSFTNIHIGPGLCLGPHWGAYNVSQTPFPFPLNAFGVSISPPRTSVPTVRSLHSRAPALWSTSGHQMVKPALVTVYKNLLQHEVCNEPSQYHRPEGKWKAARCMRQDMQPAEEDYQTFPEYLTCDVSTSSTL